MYRYRRLRDLRDDHDMVQKQVAAVLGTSQKQYSRWETGTSEIPAHHMIALARFYGVTTDYLLGLSDKMEP